MRYFLLIFIWLFLYSCNNRGSIRTNYENNLPAENVLPYAESSLSKLFTSGQHNASLITNKDITTEQKSVLQKLLNIIESNPKIQDEVDIILKNPELVNSTQLDKVLGLNKKQFNLLLSIFNKKETSTENGIITISKDGGRITFRGSGRFSILDSLIINSSDSSATFKKS